MGKIVAPIHRREYRAIDLPAWIDLRAVALTRSVRESYCRPCYFHHMRLVVGGGRRVSGLAHEAQQAANESFAR
jgi:hypothetical protein